MATLDDFSSCCLVTLENSLGKTSKKKSKKSDIVTKGRVGWDLKTYF